MQTLSQSPPSFQLSRIIMATSTTQTTGLLVWSLLAALTIFQNLVFPVHSASSSTFQDQKNFFFPPIIPGVGSPPIIPGGGSPPIDPGVGSPPVTLTPPVVSSPPIVYHTSPPPTYGSGGSTPPVHHTPPSHGGGSHHHGRSPPSNCGNPTPRSPPRHAGHHNPSPAPPTYHYNPPSSGGSTPTPTVPSSSPPIVVSPTTPGTPLFPSPPFDPNSPPIGGTCDYWRNHPAFIWGLFGWWNPTIGSAFGTAGVPGTGAHLNLLQALSNTRTDGIGALYREGTASLLNSMVNKNFPYTTSHVKNSFVVAVGSNAAAAAQARLFKLANEGHMKLRV
ncbi:hypothetical protein R6Q57_007544 [Mikania cordata]